MTKEEESLSSGRAEVLRYCPQTNSWASLDGGLSRVDVCGAPGAHHRVVAVSAFRHTPVLNLPVYGALTCTPLSQVFRHLSGVHGDYGLNFASPEEAAAFSRAFDAAVAASASASLAPAPHGCYDTLYARIVGSPFSGLFFSLRFFLSHEKHLCFSHHLFTCTHTQAQTYRCHNNNSQQNRRGRAHL